MAGTLAGGVGSQGWRERSARLLLVTVVVALVGSACAGPKGSVSPSHSPASSTAVGEPTSTPGAASPTTVGTTGPSDTAAPSAAPTIAPTSSPFAGGGDWASFELPPLQPVATLAATRSGLAGAALDTAFRLQSKDGTPATTLAARLEVQPAIALRRGDTSGDAVTLRPATKLTAGQTYRFTLRRTDGTIAQTWAVVAAKPLRVVTTVPGDESTEVPRDTGIEFTFNQPGVTADAVRDAFSISPKVSGRFEVSGRTVAFVPSSRLKALTLYTVKLRKGIPLPGTDQTMQQDVVIRFETRTTSAQQDALVVYSRLVDTGAGSRPVIGLSFQERSGDERVKAPATVPVKVHRLSGLTAATAAYAKLVATPDWAHSGGAPVDTSDLSVVYAAKVPVRQAASPDNEQYSVEAWVVLPKSLGAGWYIVTLTYGGQPQQVLVQATDLAAYAMVATDRTAVWVNSVANGRPVAGAAVTLAGKSLGETGSDGLRIATTPAVMREPASESDFRFVIVRSRGRAVFVPVAGQGLCEKCDPMDASDATSADDWWHALILDRWWLRPTDHANLWGVVRRRSDGSLPESVVVRIVAEDDRTLEDMAVVSTTVKPTPVGVFAADLAFEDVPVGGYTAQLVADGTVLQEAWINIEPIVKPAYLLTLSTNKRAVVSGTTVATTVKAAFFEGTPVGGADLRIGRGSADDDEDRPTNPNATTDINGTARANVRLTMGTDEDYDTDSQWDWMGISAYPTLPEEADLSAQTWVAVFRSTALMDVDADLAGKRLTVTGSVHDVDFAHMQTIAAHDWDADPEGAPRANARVRLTFTDMIPVRRKIGTQYDFISKTVRPVYEYDTREVSLGSRTVRTNAKGIFKATLTVPSRTHSYRIRARYVDEGDRVITARAWASADDGEDSPEVWLDQPTDATGGSLDYSIGEPVRVTVMGGHPKPSVDRYLFTVTHQGLRVAKIQSGPTLTTTFRASWVPSADVHAARFTGTAYEIVHYPATLTFDRDDRRMRITLTPDAKRYLPGGSVKVSVRTLDPSGDPVAASVVLRVIDEKLFAMGAAQDVDLLGELYNGIGNGVLAMASSHHAPDRWGDGGDTTGGGGDGQERTDFRDFLLFRVVDTGADGRAAVTFDLSDDLTSWRILAAGVDAALEAGDAVAKVPVGLPFFVEATLAAEYLVGEEPIVRMRGFGTALDSGDTVQYTVSAPTLGVTSAKASAKAFAAAGVDLPPLKEGTHRIRISAVTGSGSSRREDVLVRTITVIPTRSVQGFSASAPLTDDFTVRGGSTGLTSVVLADAGRGRVVPTLIGLAVGDGGRADQVVAASVARAVLRESFGMAATVVATGDGDASAFQHGWDGIAILPYGSSDLELSALVALADDPTVNAQALASYFHMTIEENDSTEIDRRIVALAGLAALGEAVLPEVRELAGNTKLTPTERTWLALAALAAGDEALAADLERSVLSDVGQRLGPWVRASTGVPETTSTLTALLGIVAAGVGDALAADMDAYVEANPPKDTLVDLERALAARYWAVRTPGQDAVATVTVGGKAQRVAIEAGEPVWLTLTPTQVASATIDPVSGSVTVSTTWEGPLDADSLVGDGVTTFTRKIVPSGAISMLDHVVVQFTVELGTDADDGCWRVTDLAPSGLAPIKGGPMSWDDGTPGWESPWRVVGQRVDFCVGRDPKNPVRQLRYVARVVSPGTYRWESPVIQSTVVPERGVVLPARDLVILAK